MSRLPEPEHLPSDIYSLILRLRACIARHPIVTMVIIVVIAAGTFKSEWTITSWILPPLIIFVLIASIWIAVKRRRAGRVLR